MKKNKLLIRFGIICAVLLSMYAVLRISGGLQFYQTPTSGNSPGIEPNSYIFVSNWVSYERFDFVCYEAEDPFIGHSTFTHRLCGIAGDTVQIINGDLFVNSENVDKTLNVKHNYVVPQYSSFKIRKLDGVEYLGRTIDYIDSVILAIPLNDIPANFQARQIIDDPHFKVHEQFPSEWTMDNFGPMVLDEGEIFLLGDNRNNSLDSRSNGLSYESDIVGVVLNK